MSPQQLQQMIETRFGSLSPELQRAARWVSRHGAVLAMHSMRDSAAAAGVTPATMTRLAQRLGFEGFDGLREPFRRELAGESSSAGLRRARQARRGSDETLTPLNALHQANVASVSRYNSPAAVDKAAQAVLKARSVGFLGLRVCHGVAYYLAYAYGLLRSNGQLLTGTGGTLADQVARMDEADVLVAVSQSPYTRQAVEAVAQARGQGVGVVALTDSGLSPLAREAQHVLRYDTASNAYFHSTAGAQALAEVLAASVAAHGGAETLAHLRRMQAHLRRSGAYWERPEDKE